MEPAQAKVRYVINSKVVRIEKRHRKIWVSGSGDSAIFHEQDMGWWLVMTGSYESLYLGEDQPPLKEDDKIRITLERVDE